MDERVISLNAEYDQEHAKPGFGNINQVARRGRMITM